MPVASFLAKKPQIPYGCCMAETATKPGGKTLAVPMTDDERASLDRLCAEDMRSRPAQVRWLVAQEAARRDEARAAESQGLASAA